MSIEREKLWSAYLDGELSASEAASFDESLSPRESDRLAAEMRLENGLGDALSQAPPCPDAVWASLQTKIQPGPATMRASAKWYKPTLPAAIAMIVLIGAGAAYFQYQREAAFLRLPGTVDDLALHAEWRESWTHVQDFFHENHFELALRPLDSEDLDVHSRIQFLGASRQQYHGEDVIELMFDCCRRPIMLAVARRDSDAAAAIAKSVGEGTVRDSRIVGDYVVAYVGNHPAYGLMDIFVEI